MLEHAQHTMASEREQKSPRSYEQLRATFTDNTRYNVLNGEHQRISYTDASGRVVHEAPFVWTDEYVREQYVKETDEMIGRLDGSINEKGNFDLFDERIPEGEPRVPQSVIYLDKSARPVSWFVDAFWDQMAQPGAQKPQAEFINIDRINWFTLMGHSREIAANSLTADDVDINKIDPKKIAAIRAYFTEGELDPDTWLSQVDTMPTRLDGQHVLIVDEVRNQGGTLKFAFDLLRKAIPEATFDATYFWHAGRISIDGQTASSNALQMTSAPLWYSAKSELGRGIGDISLHYQEQAYQREPSQKTLRNKIAAFALSAPLHDVETFEARSDAFAEDIQRDIFTLADGVAAGRVVRFPSRYRSDSDIDMILESQGLSPLELRTLNGHRTLDNKDSAQYKRR